MAMRSLGAVVRHDARAILSMDCCADETSVERMAHRWYLEAGDAAEGRPDRLLAPRFSRVPALTVPVPAGDAAYDVLVTGWSPYGWFNHLRVTFPGASFPVTVTDPCFCGRPGYEERMKKGGRPQLWSAYAVTVPAGTSHVEISKTEEVEAGLVAVEFRPCADPETRLVARPVAERPIVAGIVDIGILAAETLQAYDRQSVCDFYGQMARMGFTDIFAQVYGGRASWSTLACAYGNVPYGHKDYANWNEPAKSADFMGVDNVTTMQEDLDAVGDAGMRATASFRINNEWLADWVKEHWKGEWPPEIASQFSVDHPEFWMTWKSGGRSGGGLDFAFPEVREYRRDIIAEWCDKFERFDGICIDVHRHPQMVSYPEHLVQAFKEKTGIDVRTVEPIDENTMIPEWLAFRAEPFTEFMRMVRAVVKERCGDDVLLSARVGNTWEQALVEGCDLRTWIDERLVDMFVLQHRPPANPLEADTRPIVDAAHAAGVKVVHLFGGNIGVQFDGEDLSPIRPQIDTWSDLQSDGFGFYEAERIGRDGRWLREMPDVVEKW